MNEYIKKTAPKGAQSNTAAPVQAKTNGIPNSAMQDVLSGKAHATSQMMGHSQNLAPSIAAKMSQAFGMNLSGMQVYRSDAMVGSGMEGMASGNKVVLSSDVDLNTTAGQAVLGHEISHIRAQSQGIGMGNSGLYENAALEHQADTEGLLAAQGKSIYQSGGMDTGIGMQYGLGMQGVENITSLSGGMSASAGAPMQAKKGKKSAEMAVSGAGKASATMTKSNSASVPVGGYTPMTSAEPKDSVDQAASDFAHGLRKETQHETADVETVYTQSDMRKGDFNEEEFYQMCVNTAGFSDPKAIRKLNRKYGSMFGLDRNSTTVNDELRRRFEEIDRKRNQVKETEAPVVKSLSKQEALKKKIINQGHGSVYKGLLHEYIDTYGRDDEEMTRRYKEEFGEDE